MTTESVASESLPVENVLDAPVETADADPPEAPVVADSTPAPEAGETPVKKQEGFSKRIDELTRDYYGEKGRAERAEADLRALRKEVEELKPKPEAQSTTPPKLEDFGFDEEKYREADRKYVIAEAARAAREVLEQHEQQQQAQSRAETFATRQRDYLAKNPEYQNKVMENSRLPISEAMRDIIVRSEFGPQMAEYLADNMEEATAIYRMDPVSMAMELGAIRAKVQAPPAPPVIVPKVSSAPPPPQKIEAKDAAPPKSIDDPSLSDAEFARIRRRQIAQRR